jgi:N-methylhydantoinase A
MDGQPILGIDIGGTFTDLQLRFGERTLAHKVLSTPERFARGVLQGVRELLERAGAEGLLRPEASVPVRHGSTVATNAFLERRGARVALLCTAGFEDLLEIGRQNRPALYDLDTERPAPVVAAGDRHGVTERIAAPDGAILVPLDHDQVEELLDRVQATGIESVAVSLLFSFLAPAHEAEVARRARARGLWVSVSSELLPEFREFERTATTAINAHVAPCVGPYLQELQEGLAAAGTGPLWVFGSAGTLLSVEGARKRAVDTLLSGPAGGVIGAWEAARRAGHSSILTYDMGGTSTDVSLCQGAPTLTTVGLLDGLPVHAPRLDLQTVGAGGGSIAWLDDGGALRVGPQSAGAAPGPACYGQGGTAATISDANLVLGRLAPDHFLGGRMALDPERARAALAPLADRLRVTHERAALDVLAVAGVTMARALRAVSIERGHDVRDCTLVCFGGAGGMHAADLARDVGIGTVLVPWDPGVLSAAGMTRARLATFASRTVMRPLVADAARELEAGFKALEAQALDTLGAEGLPRERACLQRLADLRYAGQSYELSVPAGTPVVTAELQDRFHDQHEHRFGYRTPDAPVQVVTLRVHGKEAPSREPAEPQPMPPVADPGPPLEHRHATFPETGQVDLPLYRRDALSPGAVLPGPALVLEDHATTVVPPGDRLQVDAHRNLLITIGARR